MQDTPLIAELEILAAAHTLMREAHERLMNSPHTHTELVAHTERLQQHVARLKQLTARVMKRESRETFFLEAATAVDPRRQQERLSRVAAVVRKRRLAERQDDDA